MKNQMKSIVVFILSFILAILNPIVTGCSGRMTMKVTNWQRQRVIRMEIEDEVSRYLARFGSPVPADTLMMVCLRDGLDITMTLAQGELESGLGTRGRSRWTGSIWGVGAWDGDHAHRSIRYTSPGHAAEHYSSLIRKRYIAPGMTHTDLMRGFVDVNGKRYAADPDYERKLRNRYNYILTHTKIDSLQKEYRKFGK